MSNLTESQQVSRLKKKMQVLAEENDKLLHELVRVTNELKAMTSKAKSLQEQWLRQTMRVKQTTVKPAVVIRPRRVYFPNTPENRF